MIIIEHFQNQIPKAIGDHYLLQLCFLNRLFPESYPIEECLLAEEASDSNPSYQKVAASGYLLSNGHQSTFSEGMIWLSEIEFPEELLRHPIALLGIAFGLRSYRNDQLNIWWDSLLADLQERENNYLLSALLKAIVADIPTQFDPNSLSELDICKGLFLSEMTWSGPQIGKYLNQRRKIPFPYYDDFFRNMLAVFIMDTALQKAMISTETLAAAEKEAVDKAFQSLETKLEELAARRAQITIGIAAIIGIALNISACAILFLQWSNAEETNAIWGQLKILTLWIGGPVTTSFTLLSAIWMTIKGKELRLDFLSLKKKLNNYLIRIWRRQLGLQPNKS